MYEIHFRRSAGSVNDYALVGRADTIDQAAQMRTVSGDLVVHAGCNRIVTDPSWLFDWERKDLDCYAQTAIQHAKRERAKELQRFKS